MSEAEAERGWSGGNGMRDWSPAMRLSSGWISAREPWKRALRSERRSPSGSESLDVIFGEREAQRGAERCAQAAEIAPDGWEWWARRGSDAISKALEGWERWDKTVAIPLVSETGR